MNERDVTSTAQFQGEAYHRFLRVLVSIRRVAFEPVPQGYNPWLERALDRRAVKMARRHAERKEVGQQGPRQREPAERKETKQYEPQHVREVRRRAWAQAQVKNERQVAEKKRRDQAQRQHVARHAGWNAGLRAAHRSVRNLRRGDVTPSRPWYAPLRSWYAARQAAQRAGSQTRPTRPIARTAARPQTRPSPRGGESPQQVSMKPQKATPPERGEAKRSRPSTSPQGRREARKPGGTQATSKMASTPSREPRSGGAHRSAYPRNQAAPQPTHGQSASHPGVRPPAAGARTRPAPSEKPTSHPTHAPRQHHQTRTDDHHARPHGSSPGGFSDCAAPEPQRRSTEPGEQRTFRTSQVQKPTCSANQPSPTNPGATGPAGDRARSSGRWRDCDPRYRRQNLLSGSRVGHRTRRARCQLRARPIL